MESIPDYADIVRLIQSPEGRKLLAMLQNADGAMLNYAVTRAKQGDYEGAKQALNGILKDPEAKEILETLGGKYGGNGR